MACVRPRSARAVPGLALGLTVLVAGCAGDGARAPAPRPVPAAVPPAAAAEPVPTPTPIAPSRARVTTRASTCGEPDFVATALARINERRAAGAACGARGTFAPARALAWSEPLALAADAHSRDMVGANFFAHVGSARSTLASRVDATGYAWGALAENLAASTPTVRSTVDVWIASPGHCANLLDAAYTEVGLACVPGTAGTTHRRYWTMTLGRPR
jgi:uncharacterized protein YkwD